MTNTTNTAMERVEVEAREDYRMAQTELDEATDWTQETRSSVLDALEHEYACLKDFIDTDRLFQVSFCSGGALPCLTIQFMTGGDEEYTSTLAAELEMGEPLYMLATGTPIFKREMVGAGSGLRYCLEVF